MNYYSQHNNCQHYDTQHDDILHNGTRYNGTLHYGTRHNDTQQSDTQHWLKNGFFLGPSFAAVQSVYFTFSFRIDNTDHIIDVNEGSTGSPFEYDQGLMLLNFFMAGVTKLWAGIHNTTYNSCPL
jgi:hypothetical protein